MWRGPAAAFALCLVWDAAAARKKGGTHNVSTKILAAAALLRALKSAAGAAAVQSLIAASAPGSVRRTELLCTRHRQTVSERGETSAREHVACPRCLAKRARRRGLFGLAAGLAAALFWDVDVAVRRRAGERGGSLRLSVGRNALTTLSLHLSVRALEMVLRAGALSGDVHGLPAPLRMWDRRSRANGNATAGDSIGEGEHARELAANGVNGATRAALSALPPWLRLPHFRNFDVWTFQWACGFIMSFWFFAPEVLPVVYKTWISTFADMDETLLGALRGMRDGSLRYGVHSDFLADYCDRYGVPRREGDPGVMYIPCSTVHPLDGMSCNRNALRRFARGFRRAFMLYLPVHLASLAIGSFKKEAALEARAAVTAAATAAAGGSEEPNSGGETTGKAKRGSPRRFDRRRVRAVADIFRRGLPGALLGACRSASFLGAFIAIIWRTICLVRFVARDRLGREPTLGPVIGSALCGLSLFAEKATRRAELACYVVPRALQSMWALALGKKLVSPLPFFDAALVAASCGVFFFFFEVEAARAEMARHRGESPIMRPLAGAVLRLIIRD
jgi:hypothetical protein